MVHATVWLCTELMPSRWNFALQWVSVIGWTTFTLLNPGCKYSISVGSLEQVRQSTQQQHSNNIPLVMMNVNHILGKEGVNWDLKAPTRTLCTQSTSTTSAWPHYPPRVKWQQVLPMQPLSGVTTMWLQAKGAYFVFYNSEKSSEKSSEKESNYLFAP